MSREDALAWAMGGCVAVICLWAWLCAWVGRRMGYRRNRP
jgi:hypothetical protein